MSDFVENNEEAKRWLGTRPTGVVPVDEPCELGFHCPACDYELITETSDYDERLTWSEYNAMLWCYVCETDYPSALCLPNDPVRATEVFLNSVADAVVRKNA